MTYLYYQAVQSNSTGINREEAGMQKGIMKPL